ncbi:hypothetical protein B0H11DRAFT_2195227 [Mycena galericulata]|nr:hypothetical protein B0H11DRAFT_2195227 [Mycena galericulata]
MRCLAEVPKALSAGHRLAQASLTKSGDTIGGQHPAFLTAIEEIQQLFSEFLTHLDTVLHSDVGTVRPIMTPMPQDILILTHGPDDVDKPQSVEDAAEDADERDSKRRKAV